MIAIKFDKAKSFFDKAAVIGAVDEATRKNLSKAGAMVRQTDRRSMRRRKKASAPGQPPSAHSKSASNPRGPLLKDRTYFAYDAANNSVVEGPEKLGNSNAAETIEFGGTVRTKQARKIVTGKRMSAAQRAAFERKKAAGTLKSRPRVVVEREVKVAARPHTIPALNANLPKLTGLWADSVKP